MEAYLDRDPIPAGQPIQGTLAVGHTESDQIDPNSFTYEGKPLSVSWERIVEITPGSPLRLSYYSFTLPPQEPGLHVLERISATVNGRQVQSIARGFEVSTAEKKKEGAQLILKAYADPSTPVYPGQTLRLMYRYIFNTPLQLTKEELPLLDAQGFKKVGSLEVQEIQEGEWSVREVAQRVEAVAPGSFSFPPSRVVGKTSAGEELEATAPSMTLEVLSWKGERAPACFTGAIGDSFTVSAERVGQGPVEVGESVKVAVAIQGSSTTPVKMPDLRCLPGFSGTFALSDLPPEKQGGRFIVTLRPLTAAVDQIPPIRFAYYSPSQQNFVEIASSPIPLSITPPVDPLLSQSKTTVLEAWEQANQSPPPLQVAKIPPLTALDLRPLFAGVWKVLVFIPIALFFFAFQWALRQRLLLERRYLPPISARKLLERALNAQDGSPEQWALLRGALLQRLADRGMIPTAQVIVEHLPREGKVGQVRTLLLEIEKAHFSPDPLAGQGLRERAVACFDSLQEESDA